MQKPKEQKAKAPKCSGPLVPEASELKPKPRVYSKLYTVTKHRLQDSILGTFDILNPLMCGMCLT